MSRAEAPCHDCRTATIPADTAIPMEYYMVTDDVWAAAGMTQRILPRDPHRFLCIGCLEIRLGRELTPADFTDAPVNGPLFMAGKSARLLDRLGLTA